MGRQLLSPLNKEMLKTIVVILSVFVLAVICVGPLQNYLNGLSLKRQAILGEEEIIGSTSGYNPRVKEIQGVLKGLNLDPGPINGIMGPETRAAIKEFQSPKGLKETGRIDVKTLTELHRQEEVVPSESMTGVNPDSISLSQNEISTLTSEKLRGQDNSVNLAADFPSEHLEKVPSLPLKSIEKIKWMQAELKRAGFYDGSIDGKIGPQTKMSIKAFQKSKGLKSDGIIGPKTLEELKNI